MEEKQEKRVVNVDCSLCRKIGNCPHTQDKGICNLFEADSEKIKDALLGGSQEGTYKNSGLTWEEAAVAAKELGKCIRRKAWAKETFVWWRKGKFVTSDTNDPYLREVCRRTGFNKFPEREGFARVRYDSRYKSLPEIDWWWAPHVDSREATDWEVFDVPNTYEDREVKAESTFEHIFHNPGKYSDREILNLMKGIFPEKFCRCRPRGYEITVPISSYEEFFKDLHRVGSIMDDLDELLK